MDPIVVLLLFQLAKLSLSFFFHPIPAPIGQGNRDFSRLYAYKHSRVAVRIIISIIASTAALTTHIGIPYNKYTGQCAVY